ncbi:ADP-ribosylglycohydrolase family protein, partial [Streptomyces niveus]
MTEQPLRVTWVQPEDLLGHELRQASEDGRDASPQAATWHTSGGPPAPPRAGASTPPAPPELRTLALRLLDELALLPTPLGGREPTSLPEIVRTCGAAGPAGGAGTGLMTPQPPTLTGTPTPGGSGGSPPVSGRGGIGEQPPPA